MKTRLLYAVALLACTLALIPPLWALYVSLSVQGDGTTLIGFDHYREVLSQPQFWLSLWNSFAAAGLSTLVSILLGAMAAYGMTRFEGDYDGLALLILAIRMIPSIVLVIPFYLLFRQAGLLDNVGGLAVTYLTFSLPFAIWMIRGFFAAIPYEIDEAAKLDGANSWVTLWRVILPIAAAPIMTTAVLIFCFCWNEFLFALVLTGPTTATIPVALSGLQSQNGVQIAEVSAGVVLGVAPLLIASRLIQRYLVSGLTFGAIK